MSEPDLLVTARNVAGAFRQRVAHGVPDYQHIAAELPVAIAIDKLADEVERLRGVNAGLLAACEAALPFLRLEHTMAANVDDAATPRLLGIRRVLFPLEAAVAKAKGV